MKSFISHQKKKRFRGLGKNLSRFSSLILYFDYDECFHGFLQELMGQRMKYLFVFGIEIEEFLY